MVPLEIYKLVDVSLCFGISFLGDLRLDYVERYFLQTFVLLVELCHPVGNSQTAMHSLCCLSLLLYIRRTKTYTEK